MDMVRSMISHARLLLYLWGETLNTARFILNRAPPKSVPKTPYELWTDAKPKLEHVSVWRCPIQVPHFHEHLYCRFCVKESKTLPPYE